MLCDFCRTNVLGSSLTWDFHHTNPLAFRASAQSGCVFCARLSEELGGLDGIDQTFKKPQSGTSVYRWNIKKAAQIREIGEQFAVIFRPLPDVEGLADVEYAMLPERDLAPVPTQSMLANNTKSAETRA
ncbi:hypothetical protein ACHAQH_008930 [Verticillium albo-atrum]